MRTLTRCIFSIVFYSVIALSSLIILIVLILCIANIVLTNERVEKIIINQVESNLNAKASCDVTHFSLFNGFEIKNFKLLNINDLKPVIYFDELKLRYSFFPLFIGKIKIYEIGIYKPHIYIEEHNGIWNVQKLLKPHAKEDKIEEDKDKKEKEKKDEITLPVPFEILFGFVVENLSLHIKSSTYNLNLDNFSAGISFHIPPTRHIPLNLMAVMIFDKLHIKVNPDQTLQLSFVSRDIAAGPPVLFTFNLLYNPEETQVASNFKCGTHNTPIRFTRKHVAPLNAQVKYDIVYNPTDDILHCNILKVVFAQSTWISFAGTIKKINTQPTIQFAMLDSNIRLNEVYRYTSILLGKKPYFNGSLSIFPLMITGDSHELKVKGAIRGSKLAFSTGDFAITIPTVEIPYSVIMRNPFIEATVDAQLPHFVYSLDENKSRENSVSVQCTVLYSMNNNSLDIQKLLLIHKAPEIASETIRCEAFGKVILGESLNADITVSMLKFDLSSIAYTLPAQLKHSLSSSPITKPVTLNIHTDLSSSEETNSINIKAMCNIPDYSIDDLLVQAAITQKPKKGKIDISYFDVSSYKHKAHCYVKGSLMTNQELMLDIEAGAKVAPTSKVAFGNYSLSGMLQAIIALKGTLHTLVATGSLQSKGFLLSNDSAKLFVGPVDMNIPIAYSMGKSFKIPFDSTDVMNIQFFKQKANVSIGKIVAQHPSRNIAFEYVTNIHGHIGFNRNILEIKDFSAQVLKGTVTFKELYFNLADLNPQNMEFKIVLNAHDIDIGKLDKPESVKINKDSLLSFNAQVVGKNLNIAQDFDISGSVNIYKVGEQFANRLFKGINEERGRSKLGMAQFAVDNSLIITGFDFYLDKGLVYPTVLFKKKVLGVFVTVNNEQVRYERIPVVEFFNRVREETL
ncbi:MAG: AsmA family protein [Spirochaetes bacterium]|nr:AsmA family protein [Spirochaetota bacterium]